MKEFPKSKPHWLINPDTNYRLELDGFCEELNLALSFRVYSTGKIFLKANHLLESKREIS